MKKKKKNNKSEIKKRPPIIAVLGHVDHGKTTLLDKIRKTNVALKEFGGITQHTGAYQIDTPKSVSDKYPDYAEKITFIDTPGHHAFAKMRSRGANAADIAILVIAANDGIKPQTTESIDHIKNAKIPFMIALNKIDLPNIEPEIIKKRLEKAGVKLEEYGGDVPLVEVSAKTGQGLDKLLETILLLSDLYQISSTPEDKFQAIVIESLLSKQKGITATIVVKHGTLQTGEELVYENQMFKVRSLNNWAGQTLNEINPGDPAEVLGWKILPKVGSVIFKKSEAEIIIEPEKQIAIKQKQEIAVLPQEGENEEQKIKIILKADTAGTLEAIVSELEKKVDIILKGVGTTSESDILLAKTAKALVIGFNQKPSDQVLKLAQSEKVLVKTYNIIYQLFDEIKDVIEAIKSGNMVNILGEASVLAIFEIDGDTVAGAKVIKGRVAKGDQIKIMRIDEEIGRNRIKSLKHFKKDITKAEAGQEIGIGLAQKAELLTGDSIISIG